MPVAGHSERVAGCSTIPTTNCCWLLCTAQGAGRLVYAEPLHAISGNGVKREDRRSDEAGS